MKISNKIKLTGLTTWTMLITISIMTIFFIGFIVTNAFDLNVFDKRTSNFIFSFIGFTSVLIICSAILNISLNISLIADGSIQNLKEQENRNNIFNKKLLFYFLGLLLGLISFLFLGDYLTRQSEKNELIFEAKDIISRYQTSIDRIPTLLEDTSQLSKVPEILNILSNQKEEFPSVSLITSDKYDNQITFLEINSYFDNLNLKKQYYDNSFYKCKSNDCEYLNNFFTGKTTEQHFWIDDNEYKFYFPFVKKDKRYILLFTKTVSYGKIGSRSRRK